MDDVDFSKAEDELANESKKTGNKVDENLEGEIQNLDKNFDVYKKIINKILLNMKLRAKNICIRILSEKPYKETAVPFAPCFLFKIGEINVKKDLTKVNPENVDESQLIFTKLHKYDIKIASITAHMMNNYSLKPVKPLPFSYFLG
jgi:hypothetical protein